MAGREPLLPKSVVVFIAVVVTVGWLATVGAALRNPSGSGPLITVSGLLAMIISATFGWAQLRTRRNGAAPPPEPQEREDEVS